MSKILEPAKSSETVSESELKAKAVAPRVTLEALEDNIVAKNFFTVGEAATALDQPTNISLDLLTICVLTLKNGFTVLGQSACADPNNFDPSIGQRLAYTDAKNKIWPLMGYELRTLLSQKEI